MSKTLIVLIVGITGLLSVGCATTLTPEEQKALREKVIGTYEPKLPDGHTGKMFLLDNGVIEIYLDGKKWKHAKWKIINKEIQVVKKDVINIFRINKDGSLTPIAVIRDGERTEIPKEKQSANTVKKIK